MSSAYVQHGLCPYHGGHEFLVQAFGPAERIPTGYYGDGFKLKTTGWDKENAMKSVHEVAELHSRDAYLKKIAKLLYDKMTTWNTEAYVKTCMSNIAFYYHKPSSAKRNSSLQVGCLKCDRMTNPMYFAYSEHGDQERWISQQRHYAYQLREIFRPYLGCNGTPAGNAWCSALVHREHLLAQNGGGGATAIASWPRPPPPGPPPAQRHNNMMLASRQPPPPVQRHDNMMVASGQPPPPPPPPAQHHDDMMVAARPKVRWWENRQSKTDAVRVSGNGSSVGTTSVGSTSVIYDVTSDAGSTAVTSDGDRDSERYRCFYEDLRNNPDVIDEQINDANINDGQAQAGPEFGSRECAPSRVKKFTQFGGEGKKIRDDSNLDVLD